MWVPNGGESARAAESNARQVLNFPEQPGIQSGTTLHRCNQDVLAGKSRIDCQQIVQRTQEQPGSDQKQKRETHLKNYQSLTEQDASRFRANLLAFDGRRNIDVSALEGGDKPEKECGANAQNQRE